MLNYSIGELRWCYWSLPHIRSHIWVMSINSRCLFLLCQKLCCDLYFLLNWRNLCGGCKTAPSHGHRGRASKWNTHTSTHTSERYNCLADAATLKWKICTSIVCVFLFFFLVRQYPAGMLKRTGLFPPHNRHQWVQQGHQLQRLELIYSKCGGRAKAGGAGEEGGWVVCCLCVVISKEKKLWYKTQFTTTTGNFFIPLWDAKCFHPSGCSAVFLCVSQGWENTFSFQFNCYKCCKW